MNDTVTIPVPQTTFKANFTSNDNLFKVTSDSFTPPSTLNVSSRTLTIGSIDYQDSDFNATTTSRYQVKAVQAFEIVDNSSLNSFTIIYNVSDLDLVHPAIFQTPYDFSSEYANTSSQTIYLDSTNLNFENDLATITGITGFSAFFIAEDLCQNSVQNSFEDGVDCGGPCDDDCSTSTGGSTGGGGGGGGGSSSVAKQAHVVVPTDSATTLELRKGDTITFLFEGVEYLFDVIQVGDLKLTLQRSGTPYQYAVKLGEDKIIGLKEIFSDDIIANVELSDHFAIMSVKLVPKKKAYALNLLPPKKTTTAEQVAQETTEVATETAAQATATPQQVTQTQAQATQKQPAPPKSPINWWTWIIALTLVVIIVGGIAVFRHQLSVDKPPTATRTGLDSISETPPTSEPVLSSTSVEMETAKPLTGQPSSEIIEQVKPKQMPKQEQKPALVISKKQQAEVEKYIYHALAHGFSKEDVVKVLEGKGWPDPTIDEIFSHINLVDNHMDKAGLHTDDLRLAQAVKAIEKLKTKGFNREQIKQGLVRKGWANEVADHLLDQIF